MTQQDKTEHILRQRMHGLYLSRPCRELDTLSHELMGLHSWFYRNVAFSALIRGADIAGWKTRLTKTWLYRGTLHGVVYEDLPQLLALHQGESYLSNMFGKTLVEAAAADVIRYMEDGVTSRAEFRRIFSAIQRRDDRRAVFALGRHLRPSRASGSRRVSGHDEPEF
ncbi:MAG: hypothetical protein Q8S22_10190 [Eubacteriales bacterium]|nr:hypothetical protein [Eubacteriales bacterium]